MFRPFYCPNHGDPVGLIREYLTKLYADYPGLTIAGSAVTGYGGGPAEKRFSADHGIVETVAHYTAAKKFHPDVDFIIDIGGQDIKCFQIKNGLIDSLYLNEACSSGCGSFLQTFAQALGYTSEEFARLGLFADAPVGPGQPLYGVREQLREAGPEGRGQRGKYCGRTVHQRGEKRSGTKSFRCADAKSLGKNIVVQGGTFLNDCVLRAFEQEIGANVIRPKFAGLMGAYGGGPVRQGPHREGKHVHYSAGTGKIRSIRSISFPAAAARTTAPLTVNTFSGGRRYIAGNRCSRPPEAGAHGGAL